MKEENEKAGVRNKKLYLYIALGCAAVLLCAAIIVTAVVLANRSRVSIDAGDNSGGQIETPDPDQPVIETPEEFISPVSVVSVLNEYGFYYNKTLGNYYEHMGDDFTAEVGSEVTFDRVLMLGGDTAKIGTPLVDGAKVTAKVLEHFRGEKVQVFKKRRRKAYRNMQGHRQDYTALSVTAISA